MITYEASFFDRFLFECRNIYKTFSQKAGLEGSEYTSGMHPFFKKNNGKISQTMFKNKHVSKYIPMFKL